MGRSEIFGRALIAGCLLAASLSLASCVGDDKPESPSPTPNPPVGNTPTVRSGSRLAWDQAAPSVQQLRTYSYRLYVDTSVASLSDVRCAETAGAAGYECSGRLPSMPPGLRQLRLTAIAQGVESPQSLALTVNVVSSTQSVERTAISSAESSGPGGTTRSDRGAPRVGCFGAGLDDCYDIRTVASGLGRITAAAAMPDGRLLLVEDHARIRITEGDGLRPEPALSFAGAEQIHGLTVDRAFERTRAVFVAWSDERPDGARELHVSRYRELAGVLGEGAAIVSGLPVPRDSSVPLATAADGHLYLSLPAAMSGGAGSGHERPRGAVLRFTREGQVPADHVYPSPVLADGFANPAALVTDTAGRVLWLAGRDMRWEHPVAWLTAEGQTAGRWPRTPSPGLRPAAGTRPPTQDVRLAYLGGDEPALLIVFEHSLYRAGFDREGHLEPVERFAARGLNPIGVVGATAGRRFHVIAEAGGTGTYLVLRVGPR